MLRIARPLKFSQLVFIHVWLDRSKMVSINCGLCANKRSGAGKSSHIFCLDPDGTYLSQFNCPCSAARAARCQEIVLQIFTPLCVMTCVKLLVALLCRSGFDRHLRLEACAAATAPQSNTKINTRANQKCGIPKMLSRGYHRKRGS